MKGVEGIIEFRRRYGSGAYIFKQRMVLADNQHRGSPELRRD
jgi:hypothetical protein